MPRLQTVLNLLFSVFLIDFPASTAGQGVDGTANAICTRQSYEVSVVRNQTAFHSLPFTTLSPFPIPDNQSQITFLFNQLFKSPVDFQNTYVNPSPELKSETFSISGILCIPEEPQGDLSTVELLVHGIGFDSSYWNFGAGFGLSTDYSYIHAAAAAGKTTFRYDRLGTGQSDKPNNAYDVVQASTDVAILKELVAMLRRGEIGTNGRRYTKIVGIGHSYGSFQLNGLLIRDPTAVDALILTGFSANATNTPVYIVSADYSMHSITNQAARFTSLNNSAYLLTGTNSSGQLNFQWYPGISAEAAAIARITEQPVTQGVLFTIGSLGGPTEYEGPLQMVNGVQDFIFCSSNCLLPVSSGPKPNASIAPDNQIGNVQALWYPRVTTFSWFAANNTGHGSVEHYSAPAQYKAMLDFLTYNGF